MRVAVPFVLLIVAVIVSSVLVPNFLDAAYLLDKSTIYMEIGLLALGLCFVIACGEIDLSVGSNVALTGCLTALVLKSGASIPAAMAFACLCGTVLGTFNGLLVAHLRLPSFLVTLGTMAAFRGAAQAIVGADSIALPDAFKGLDQSTVIGLPWPLVIFLVVALLMGAVFHRTVLGRQVVAVGTNESASRYSGIPVERTKVLAFALTGLLAGIAALLIDSRLAVARYDLAKGMELEAITVAVVGGAAIQGGVASIPGAVVSLFLILVIKTAMGVANVKPEYQLTAIGTLLILAVIANNVAERRFRRATMTS